MTELFSVQGFGSQKNFKINLGIEPMNPGENSAEPITTLFIDQVKPDIVSEYEAWFVIAVYISGNIVEFANQSNPVMPFASKLLQNWLYPK